MTISNESRGRIKKIFEPIALAMGRIGLTPNGLTLIGFAITAVGAILVGAQAWVIGGIVVFVGGVFDMFDGTLARATGQASKFGAFMDSTFDKAGEILVFLGCIAALAQLERRDGAGRWWPPPPWVHRSWSATPGRSPTPSAIPPAWAWPPSASCPARSAS